MLLTSSCSLAANPRSHVDMSHHLNWVFPCFLGGRTADGIWPVRRQLCSLSSLLCWRVMMVCSLVRGLFCWQVASREEVSSAPLLFAVASCCAFVSVKPVPETFNWLYFITDMKRMINLSMIGYECFLIDLAPSPISPSLPLAVYTLKPFSIPMLHPYIDNNIIII